MGVFDTGLRIFKSSIPQIIGSVVGGPQGALIAGAIERGTSGQGEGSYFPPMTLPSAPIITPPIAAQQTKSAPLGANVGVDVFNPAQTQETKVSGERMENGPMQAGVGGIVPFAQSIGRTIFGGGAGSAVVGAVGGALVQQGVQSYMGGGDACGCGPRAFVRLDKCGRPIITRAMQQKAKDMVMCMGIENAAAALGIDVPLLAEIAFKKFKPRARGISGAQLKTARRVNNRVMKMAKDLKKACR